MVKTSELVETAKNWTQHYDRKKILDGKIDAVKTNQSSNFNNTMIEVAVNAHSVKNTNLNNNPINNSRDKLKSDKSKISSNLCETQKLG